MLLELSYKHKMEKMLIINDLASGGGVERLMQDLVGSWNERYNITILTITDDPNFYNFFPTAIRNIKLFVFLLFFIFTHPPDDGASRPVHAHQRAE